MHWKIFLLSKSEKWQNWNYTASQQTTCDEETANKQHCVIYWFLCVLWRAMRHFLRYRIYIIYYEHYKHGVFLCLGTSRKGWWSWCRDLNCIPDGRMEETTWTSSDYMDEDSPRWCQVLQAHTDWDSQRGLCWKFWLRVVLCTPRARNDDDDDDAQQKTILCGEHHRPQTWEIRWEKESHWTDNSCSRFWRLPTEGSEIISSERSLQSFTFNGKKRVSICITAIKKLPASRLWHLDIFSLKLFQNLGFNTFRHLCKLYSSHGSAVTAADSHRGDDTFWFLPRSRWSIQERR